MQRGTLLIVALGLTLALPSATSQSVARAAEKAGAEADAASADPLGYVTREASPDGISEERAWAITYACEGLREASGTAGVPPPDLEACRPGPAVDAGEQPTEEPAGEAVPVADDAVGEVETLGEDALGTAGEIVRDPPDALDRIQGFAAEAVATVGRIVGDLVQALDGAVRGLAQGSATIIGSGLGTVPASARVVAADARASSDAVVGGTSGALDAATHAVARSVAAIGSWLGDLAGRPTVTTPPPQETATQAAGDAMDALAPVKDLVDGALPT